MFIKEIEFQRFVSQLTGLALASRRLQKLHQHFFQFVDFLTISYGIAFSRRGASLPEKQVTPSSKRPQNK